MSIYITGDCHSNFKRFSNKSFDYRECNKEKDFVIICGDFGAVWSSGIKSMVDNIGKESAEDKYLLNWLSEKPITFIVCPGNHENYDFVEAYYKKEKYRGGLVRKIRDNIIWVERGEILNIDNNNFLFFGGANSHDKRYRKKDITWWERECPSKIEFNKMQNNFSNNKIDYIITHEVPSECVNYIYCNEICIDKISLFLQNLYDTKEKYKYWFCGHHHKEITLNKLRILFADIIKLEDIKNAYK